MIEAVFEDLKVKQELFSQLDRVCKAECILATNTSSLDIDLIFNRVGIARYRSGVCVHVCMCVCMRSSMREYCVLQAIRTSIQCV